MGEQSDPERTGHGRTDRRGVVLRNALMRVLNGERRKENQIVEITESKISSKEQVLTKKKR